jgi:hypothetical protein
LTKDSPAKTKAPPNVDFAGVSVWNFGFGGGQDLNLATATKTVELKIG